VTQSPTTPHSSPATRTCSRQVDPLGAYDSPFGLESHRRRLGILLAHLATNPPDLLVPATGVTEFLASHIMSQPAISSMESTPTPISREPRSATPSHGRCDTQVYGLTPFSRTSRIYRYVPQTPSSPRPHSRERNDGQGHHGKPFLHSLSHPPTKHRFVPHSYQPHSLPTPKNPYP